MNRQSLLLEIDRTIVVYFCQQIMEYPGDITTGDDLKKIADIATDKMLEGSSMLRKFDMGDGIRSRLYELCEQMEVPS